MAAGTLQKIPLPGYMTTDPPTRGYWKGDFFGNNNYQQGGDTHHASDYGMGGIETFGISASGLSSSGNYSGKVFPPANASNNSEVQASAWATVTVKWFYTANNNEVANNTNLNAESLRLDIVGV